MRDVAGVFRLACCVALWAMGGLPPLTRAADPPASDKTVVSATALSPEITEAMDHLEPLWESMRSDVVSCEAKFRMFFRIKPIAPLTRDQVREKFQLHDLGEHPERTPDFLRDVGGLDAKIEVPTRQIFIQGQHRRHVLGLLTYVDDDRFSFVHDGDNQQVHVYERGRNPAGVPGLGLFRSPLQSRTGGYRPDIAEREGSLVRLITVTAPTSQAGELQTTNTIDWASGAVVNRLRTLHGEVIQEVGHSGLTTFAGGITLPRCVLTARYAKGFLQTLDLALLDEALLNEPIPESMFVVSKPEGWHVLDFREQANGASIPSPKGPVDDVRTLIPSLALNSPVLSVPQVQEPAPLSFPKRSLLVLNGLALIAVGVWMWRRASLKESKH